MSTQDQERYTYLNDIVKGFNHKNTKINKNKNFDFDRDTYTKKEFNDMWDEMLMSSFGCQVGILKKAIEQLASDQYPTHKHDRAIEILDKLIGEVWYNVGYEGVNMPSVKTEEKKPLGYFEAMDKGMTFEEWMMS